MTVKVSYPSFHNRWPQKDIDEIWAGATGFGKTLVLNVFLTQRHSIVENQASGVQFFEDEVDFDIDEEHEDGDF